MLSAKTPQMVRKDLWAILLAYNLLRTIMLQTALSSEQDLSRLSLQGTRQQDLLPLRVFRSEPRVVKRRPKPLPRMNKPRAVLKAALVN
jgi:hypothetical protein